MIPGLTYVSDFVSEEEQTNLLIQIDQLPWLNDLKRRTQHYGYKYDYTKKKIDPSLKIGDIPEWINPFCKKLVRDGIFEQEPDQVIINEYLPGQGISRHIDCIPCFDRTVASLSLESSCTMEFENIINWKKGSMLLAPRSLLALTDEARYKWMHSIPARMIQSRRVSLTFRKVLL